LGGQGGKAPRWPGVEGPKVFAYLKPFAGLDALLTRLTGNGCRSLLYINGLDAAIRRRFESPTMHFERERLDLAKVAAESDLAILHAGQGTTAAMLLAGKPVLQLPMVLEQRLTADATVRLGAGERATPTDAAAVAEKLDGMLGSGRYAEAAGVFAAKYAGFDAAAQVERMAARVEELPGGQGPRAAGQRLPTRAAAGVFRS
jgi:hypothetical protein